LASNSPVSGTEYEIGGDIERPWSDAFSSKLVGLYSLNNVTARGNVTRIGANGVSTGRITENRDRAEEAVLRLQNSYQFHPKLAFEFGGEIARNRLEASFTDRAGTQGTASTVDVRELRFEPFASAKWTATPKLQVEANLIIERSILEVASAGTKESRFIFWKPSLRLDWARSEATKMEFTLAREAAQLDFSDFATSVDLSADGQIDFGNRELIPETTWTASYTLRHSFWQTGSFEFEASFVQVDDFQDLVPVNVLDGAGAVVGRFDGPGNIGDGQRWNLEFQTTLPIYRLIPAAALKGLDVSLLAHYHGSRVSDPVTGQSRLQSGTPEFHFNVSVRQEVGTSKLTWGASISFGQDSQSFFIDQISAASFGGNLDGFVEYSGWKLGKLRLDISNINDSPVKRQRTFFTDMRTSNAISQIFTRDQRRDQRIKVSLSRSF
jgi:hypothetical protein